MVFASGGFSVKIYDNQPGQAAKAITEIKLDLLHKPSCHVVLINAIFKSCFLFMSWSGKAHVVWANEPYLCVRDLQYIKYQ